MFLTIFKRIFQQLLLLILVSVILLAAYVSVGRLFMPAISGYVDAFEETIMEYTGVPVSVNSVSYTHLRAHET